MEFKMRKPDEEDSFDAGFKLPDTKSTLSNLTEALRREHEEMTKEEEKQGAVKKRQRQGGTVCCCEDPNCRIGPFIEKG